MWDRWSYATPRASTSSAVNRTRPPTCPTREWRKAHSPGRVRLEARRVLLLGRVINFRRGRYIYSHSSEHSTTRACQRRTMDSASAPSLPDCAQSRRQRQPSKEAILRALAQYIWQPANQPECLAGAVQPPVALEVAARV
eukprot:scaffold494_cov117-Isochrysis_galbana.AAC.13